MSRITSLALTDVRCFAGTQRTGLPRVAVLVGDNGTGKSGLMGRREARWKRRAP